MSKRKRQQPPVRTSIYAPKLYLLDAFSANDVAKWEELSKDLDELIQRLYLDAEPARNRYRENLLDALSGCLTDPFTFEGWVRGVPYRWSNEPLSCAGSIRTYGGRFNVGVEIEHAIDGPFPALYLAENFETAFREMRQLGSDEKVAGLNSDELSLSGSLSAVRVNGYVERVLDIRDVSRLQPFLKVLKRIKLPLTVQPIMRRLKIKPGGVAMINSMPRLEAMLKGNWREWPVQYGVPASTQIFGSLAIAAGYEAILYRSSKLGDKDCIAVFPGSIASERTFISLMDAHPDSVSSSRLDLETCEQLDGMSELWVPKRYRRRTAT